MAWGNLKEKYDIYSSTKSLGVTALGLALMDGKMQLHDKAKRHLPSGGTPPQSSAQSGWPDELTLWHLATQTGGFEKKRGWCRQVHRPGTTWIYRDGGPNWPADCLTVAYGGTQTFLLAAVDDRVKAAVPVCMVSSYVQGGCNCANAPGLRIDTHNTESAAVMAPRPMMLISVTKDRTRHTLEVELPAIRSI